MTGVQRVLALDLGATLGWAVAEGESLLPLARRSGYVDLCGDGALGSRVAHLEDWLRGREAPDLVLYELVMGHGRSGSAAQHAYGAYQGAVLSYCWRRRIRYLGVDVSDWKELAVGSRASNAPKPTLERSREAFGPEVMDQNQAEALWVLQAGLRRMREGG